MARIEVRVPPLGETVPQGVITRWYRQVGDRVARAEVILEFSTDKVDVELEAPASGRLAEILARDGQTVSVNEIIGFIETDDLARIDAAPAPAVPRVPELDCLRCGARLQPTNAVGGRVMFAGEPVRLLVCRQCGHVEMIAEDPARF